MNSSGVTWPAIMAKNSHVIYPFNATFPVIQNHMRTWVPHGGGGGSHPGSQIPHPASKFVQIPNPAWEFVQIPIPPSIFPRLKKSGWSLVGKVLCYIRKASVRSIFQFFKNYINFHRQVLTRQLLTTMRQLLTRQLPTWQLPTWQLPTWQLPTRKLPTRQLPTRNYFK